MKTYLPFAFLLVLALSSISFAQTPAQPTPSPSPKPAMSKAQILRKLSAAEKSLWEAWKNKDTKPFKALLSADAIMVSDSGTQTKADALKDMGAGGCDVASYELSDWKLSLYNSSTAMLTYKGTVDATCGGQKLPPTVWCSSLWVNRGGKWTAASHQETPGK